VIDAAVRWFRLLPCTQTQPFRADGLVFLEQVLLAASLFFTTARSFLPNDMQPLEEGIASEMR